MTTNDIIIIIMIMKNNQMFHPINDFLHMYIYIYKYIHTMIITYHIFIMKLTFESHITWCPTLADQMLRYRRYLKKGPPNPMGKKSDLT